MTPDQINAKVAEILLDEGQKWGYGCEEPICYHCQTNYKKMTIPPKKCWRCNEPVTWERMPLDFCSDPAAAWRLLEYILKPKDDERPAKINLWRGLRCGYEDLTWCVSTHTKGKYRCNDTNLKQALAEAFIAAKEK